MKISIDERTHEGTAVEILTTFCNENYFHDEFPDMEGYILYEQATFVQLTGQPCPLPEKGTTEERARALLHNLADIDALEVLSDE